MKKCNACLKELPLDSFHRHRGLKDGRQRTCIECVRTYYNEDYRYRKYGTTAAEYAQMFKAQGGRCAICRRTPPETGRKRNGEHVLFIDHCHETGKIRGLLCASCNTLLGMAQDQPAVLLAAADYVARFQEPVMT